MDHVFGVDIGTQGTRATLRSAAGALVADAEERSELLHPVPGATEEDPERQFGSVCRTVKACLERSGVDPGRVAAIAVDGQMAGILAVGADGRAVTPYDSWLDTRCAPFIAEMERRVGDAVLARSGNVPSFNHGPKILWWKANRPEVWARIAAFVQPGGYAAMRLCGLDGAHAFVDDTYLHFSGFARNEERRWDPELCAELGVTEGKLPRIARPADVVGHVCAEAARASGLREGTPVAAGLGDTAASFLSCGAVEAGTCVDVAGTASVFAATTPAFAADLRSRVVGCGRSAVPGLWHPYAYVNGGGLNLDWFADRLAVAGGPPSEAGGGRELGARLAELGRAIDGLVPSLEDPYFVPHMEGRVMPSAPHMRGAWIGVTRAHGLAALYRSLLEGVALEYAIYRDAVLAQHPGFAPSGLRATGGGARHAQWNQLKADVLGMPLLPVQDGGGAPMGAALVAAAAAGVVTDLAAAARAWVALGPAVEPVRRFAGVYRARTATYARLLELVAAIPGVGGLGPTTGETRP